MLLEGEDDGWRRRHSGVFGVHDVSLVIFYFVHGISTEWNGGESRNETELNLIIQIQCTPGTNDIIDGLTRVWTLFWHDDDPSLIICLWRLLDTLDGIRHGVK